MQTSSIFSIFMFLFLMPFTSILANNDTDTTSAKKDNAVTFILKRGTPITFKTTEKVSSRDGYQNKVIALEIFTDVSGDGKTIIFNQSNYGEAEVTTRKSGSFGKPGRVEIKAVGVRTVNGQRVKLEGMTVERNGKDKRGFALGMSIGVPIAGLAMSTPPGILLFGITGLFIKGKDAIMPAGEIIRAYVAEDVEVRL